MFNLKSTLARVSGQTRLATGKHGPQVLLGIGLLSGLAALIAASKATLELDAINADADLEVQRIVDGHERIPESTYTEEMYKHDLVVSYGRRWLAIGRLYAPAIGFGVLSVASILASHGMLKKQNFALMAAYKAVDGAFKFYRQNVVSELGPEKDEEFRFGKRQTVIDIGNGDSEVIDERPEIAGVSCYAAWFCAEGSTQFRNDPIHSLAYITQVQNHMNDRLNAYGHVFLNEAYSDLGMPQTSAGQIVGWMKNGAGDGLIDFGINNPRNRGLVSGKTAEALLDFNVDGVMYDQI